MLQASVLVLAAAVVAEGSHSAASAVPRDYTYSVAGRTVARAAAFARSPSVVAAEVGRSRSRLHSRYGMLPSVGCTHC